MGSMESIWPMSLENLLRILPKAKENKTRRFIREACEYVCETTLHNKITKYYLIFLSSFYLITV